MKRKKLTNLLLTAVIGLTTAGAIFTANYSSTCSKISEETITIQDGITDNLSSKNCLIMDNENIYTSDKIWNQPEGYNYYRIYVTNEQNEEMKMTLRYDKSSTQYIIPNNDSKTFIVSNAQAVEHKLSFSTESGAIKGKINVRISETEKEEKI